MRRVIVTRPLLVDVASAASAPGVSSAASDSWLHSLQARGLDAVALPLLAIAPLADTQSLAQAWQALPRYHAVMFVSVSAVAHFFAAQIAVQPTPQLAAAHFSPQAWVTGPGSRAALLQAGVPAGQIRAPDPQAAQFDSEALWQQVGAGVQPGQQFLIVRGAAGGADDASPLAGRHWLAQQLAAAGGLVTQVAAYQRSAPVWSAAQRALAQSAASDGSVWLLSSSEATAHLAHLLPQQNWNQTLAVATHERIAQAAHTLGFAQVRVARPLLADVVAQVNALGGVPGSQAQPRE